MIQYTILSNKWGAVQFYLFWAISAGIVLGAGLLPLAVFGSVFIGLILLVLVNKKSREN